MKNFKTLLAFLALFLMLASCSNVVEPTAGTEEKTTKDHSALNGPASGPVAPINNPYYNPNLIEFEREISQLAAINWMKKYGKEFNEERCKSYPNGAVTRHLTYQMHYVINDAAKELFPKYGHLFYDKYQELKVVCGNDFELEDAYEYLLRDFREQNAIAFQVLLGTKAPESVFNLSTQAQQILTQISNWNGINNDGDIRWYHLKSFLEGINNQIASAPISDKEKKVLYSSSKDKWEICIYYSTEEFGRTIMNSYGLVSNTRGQKWDRWCRYWGNSHMAGILGLSAFPAAACPPFGLGLMISYTAGGIYYACSDLP